MKNKFSYSLIVLLLFISISCSNDTSTGPEEFDFVGQIIQSVNADSLMNYVSSLSGATPVVISGQSQIIESRHKNYPGNNIAGCRRRTGIFISSGMVTIERSQNMVKCFNAECMGYWGRLGTLSYICCIYEEGAWCCRKRLPYRNW